MKLQTIRVTNFRSVEDSGEVRAKQVLCLVGKNEAGKTAIVQALAGLHPHPSTPILFEKERDYPRRFLTQYSERHKDGEAVVITTTWSLHDGEKRAIVSLIGDGGLSSEHVTVSRRYAADAPEWKVPFDYKKVIAHLLAEERLSEEEATPLANATNTDELRKTLQSIEARTAKQNSLLAKLEAFPGQNVTGAVLAILKPALPHFMYFSHYDRMDGQIRIDTYTEKLKSPQSIGVGERVFVDFLEYAGTSVEEITTAKTYETLNARCEAASTNITSQLLEYWTQNPDLEIDVRVTKAEPEDKPPFNQGVIARARVRNNLHKVSVPFSERSAGFIWFFSFLVKFAQVQKGGGPLILLLDEPGLTLHGKAQADLLRYFQEKLAPKHQVVFTTHSPFMVPPENLLDVRIVEDQVVTSKTGQRTPNGTKVSAEALATDRDSLFPLQGALGYELTQTLFIGKNTLLVEGPGDILYLQAWSNALRKRGRSALSPKWTICPAGGIDKIQPFVSLFAGAKLNIAALTDYAKADKRKFESLRQNKVLEGDRLLTFATLLGVEEADVEDVFVPSLYAQIVSEAFALPAASRPTDVALESADTSTTRLLRKTEAFFRVLPPESPEFDHFTPAAWLFQHLEVLDGQDGAVMETLRRAEAIIEKLNSLLPRS
jgi:energy-coupling factor transporter ATP-binding protein EcfA2